jgi:hypothetical protein
VHRRHVFADSSRIRQLFHLLSGSAMRQLAG